VRETRKRRSPVGSTQTLRPTSPLPIGIEPDASRLGEVQTTSQRSRSEGAGASATGGSGAPESAAQAERRAAERNGRALERKVPPNEWMGLLRGSVRPGRECRIVGFESRVWLSGGTSACRLASQGRDPGLRI
jgi:hypothetical protein